MSKLVSMVSALMLLLQIGSIDLALGQDEKVISKQALKMQKKLAKLVQKEIKIEADKFTKTVQVKFPASYEPSTFLLRNEKGKKVGLSFRGFALISKATQDLLKKYGLRNLDDLLVSLTFVSKSDSWEYLSFHSLYILVDGSQLNLEKIDHNGSVGSGYVLEQMGVNISYDKLQKLANAKVVEGRLGITEFVFTELQLAFLRVFLERVAVTYQGI